MRRESYYNLVFGIILLLLTGVSLITYWNVNGYMEEVKWIRHSNKVIAQVEIVLSIVKDSETGHRGYQLTRDTVFLRPYKSSIESIYTEVSKLDSLFLDEVVQKKRGDSLRLLIDKQYRIIKTILENEKESEWLMDRYKTNLLIVGRENMDRIRKVCGRITQYENDVLQARLTQEYDLKNIAPFTLLLSGFVVLSVAGVLFVRIIDELKRRRKTEKELNIKIEELDQKEKRYRSLFERSIDPIFLADGEFNMMDANSSLQELFGYSYEEACSLDLEELFIDKVEFTLFKEKLNRDNHVRDFEVTLKDRNNRKLVSLINCVRIVDSTSQVYYQGIIHDMTMRKKVERELIQAEKLSTTGRIARTIAHEVRNPLTNLNLALDQLKEEFTSNENTRIYTDILDRNLNRIEELISELLRSSRPKELQLSKTPLSAVLNETVDLIKDRINLNEMKLINTITPDLPSVLVDKELVKIALVNIMVNAIEAMEPGKGVLRIAVDHEGDQVVLTISDNGKGIPDKEVGKLFDPFYSAKQGGMGLGLTSTQNILNSHKIEIEVQSKLGEGTSFYIIFNAIH
ncbi:MAG TPA: CHASE3 domain-containing protein [Cyclobacteriaceae bacterium]|nr:CHASE3 domain-containing protein [Cyclobacteriaceae bacterium]